MRTVRTRELMVAAMVSAMASLGFGEPNTVENLTIKKVASNTAGVSVENDATLRLVSGKDNFPRVFWERVNEGKGTKTPFVYTVGLGSNGNLFFQGCDVNDWPDAQMYMMLTREGNIGIKSFSAPEALTVRGNIMVLGGGLVQEKAVVPQDIWSPSQLYVDPAGFIGTQGSWGLDLAWNAYRNNNDGTFGWVGINGHKQASSICLKSDGITFYADEGLSGNFRRTARMIVRNNGYVGIGTTNPAYMLDVEGTVQAREYRTGDIIFQKDGTKPVWRMYEDEAGLYAESLTNGKHYRVALREMSREIDLDSKIDTLKAENRELKLRLERLEAKLNTLTAAVP